MDKRSRQSQAEVLAVANHLASSGMRKAALDLLDEYLDENPESARVLAAVGRLYLLEKNTAKSVLYLQKSLHIGKVTKARAAAIDAYDEDYDEQDLAFANEQERESNLAADANPLKPESEEKTEQTKTNLTDGSESVKPKPAFTEHVEVAPETTDDTDTIASGDKTVRSDTVAATDVDSASESDFVLEEFDVSLTPIDEVIAKEIVQIDLLSGDANDFPDDEEFIGDEIYPDATVDAVPDEAYELSWEEIDDLDAYTPTPQEQSDIVVGKGKLNREQRAKQVAIEVMHRFELDRDFLPLLHTIFIENGWGASRVAIERELARGTLRDEFALAREVRHFWRQSDRYWITFRGLYSNSMNLQTEATYMNMSWAEALRLVACFPDLPCADEIEDLIEETFLLWYGSKRLRRSFPVFFKFLKYRTASMPGTLSRWEPRCFDAYQDDGVEDPLFKTDGTHEEMRYLLLELGVDIYKVRGNEKQYRAHLEENDGR